MTKRTRLTILAGTTAAVVLGTAGIAAACGRGGGRSWGHPKPPTTTTILTIPQTPPSLPTTTTVPADGEA